MRTGPPAECRLPSAIGRVPIARAMNSLPAPLALAGWPRRPASLLRADMRRYAGKQRGSAQRACGRTRPACIPTGRAGAGCKPQKGAARQTDNKTGDHKSQNFSVKAARGIRCLSCQKTFTFSFGAILHATAHAGFGQKIYTLHAFIHRFSEC